ncbi:MAG: hypothetical protein ACRCYU_21505 [Nocardioides sp.]
MSRWEAVTTTVVTGTLVAGALWGIGSVALTELLVSWQQSGHDAGTLHAGLLTGLAGVWLAANVHIGPVARSRAELQWDDCETVDAPVHSGFGARYLLGSSIVAVVVAFTAVVAPLPAMTNHLRGGALFLTVLVMLSALALVGEYGDARELLTASSRALAMTAMALVALSAGDRAVAGGLAVAAVVALGWGGRRRLVTTPADAPPRWLLVRAAEQRWAMHASVVLLDGSVARQVGERLGGQRLLLPRSVPPNAGPTLTRVATLLVRQAGPTTVLSVPALYLAHRLTESWSTDGAVTVALLAMGAVAVLTGASADRWADAPALRRTYAEMSPRLVLAPAMISLLAVAIGAIAILGPPLATGVLLVLLAPALVLRRHRARTSDTDGWLSSPMGAIPLGHVNRLVAGWDLVAVVLGLVALD